MATICALSRLHCDLYIFAWSIISTLDEATEEGIFRGIVFRCHFIRQRANHQSHTRMLLPQLFTFSFFFSPADLPCSNCLSHPTAGATIWEPLYYSIVHKEIWIKQYYLLLFNDLLDGSVLTRVGANILHLI